MNMADQKLENLLELSLDVSEQTREKSENLSAGYDPEEKTWEVILRYSGSIDDLAGRYGEITPLLGGYAVAVVTEAALRELSREPMVEYIEKPKALSFAVYEGKLVSCIPPVQRAPLNLTGRGVLVAVVDSGSDLVPKRGWDDPAGGALGSDSECGRAAAGIPGGNLFFQRTDQ